MKKSKYSDFDIRMKDYEHRTRYLLPKRTYTLCRIDGKGFSKYTKNCVKPFDYDLIEDMQETTKYILENVMGGVLGYHQSDEITLLLCDFQDIKSEAYFNNNLQKLDSVIASYATSKFNHLRNIRAIKQSTATSFDDAISILEGLRQAEFDCRVWTVSDPWEALNAFVWRQQDATKNAVSMAASAYISHKQLQKLNGKQKQEKLFTEHGINFNDYPVDAKRGAMVYKVENEDGRSKWFIDRDMPILTKDMAYIQSKIPLMKQW